MRARAARSDGAAHDAAQELRAALGADASALVALELGAGCNGLPGARRRATLGSSAAPEDAFLPGFPGLVAAHSGCFARVVITDWHAAALRCSHD